MKLLIRLNELLIFLFEILLNSEDGSDNDSYKLVDGRLNY